MTWQPKTIIYEDEQPNGQHPWQPRSLRYEDEQPQEPAKPSFWQRELKDIPRQLGLTARYLAEGSTAIADLPNFVINSGISGINALGGNLPQLKYPSEAVKSGLDKIGLPNPQNATERVVGDMSRAVAAASTGAGGTQSLTKYAPALKPFAENIALQARTAAGSAAAGGTAREQGAGPVGQAVASIAGGLGTGFLTAPKQKIPTSSITADDVKETAQDAYEAASKAGGALTPSFNNTLYNKMKKIAPQSREGSIFAGDTPITKALERFSLIKDKPITLRGFQDIDEELTSLVSNSVNPDGTLSKTGLQLKKMQELFRDAVESADEAAVIGGKDGFEKLKEARGLWSKQAAMRDVERIIQRAEVMENPVPALKTGFRNLMMSKRFKAFNAEEQKMIKDAAQSGVFGDLFKTLGSRLGTIGAMVVGGPKGAALGYVGTTASREIANKMQFQRAQALHDLVAQRGVTQLPKNLSTQSVAPAIPYGLAAAESNPRLTYQQQRLLPPPNVAPMIPYYEQVK